MQEFLFQTTFFDFLHNEAAAIDLMPRWGRIHMLAFQFPRFERAISSILGGVDHVFIDSALQKTFKHLLPSFQCKRLPPDSTGVQKRLPESSTIAEGFSCASANTGDEGSTRSTRLACMLEDKDATSDRQKVVPEIGMVLGFVWSTLFPWVHAKLWSFQVNMWMSAAWWGAPAVMLCSRPVQSFLLPNLQFRLGVGNFPSNNEVRMASVMSLLGVGAVVATTVYNQRLTTMCQSESTAPASLVVKSRPPEFEHRTSSKD